MNIVIAALIIILIILLSILCYSDIKRRILSNILIMAVLLVILPLGWLLFRQIFWLTAMITLVVGFVLFLFNLIGAGDVKLLAVLMLMVPMTKALPLLVLISLWGLPVIVMGWLFRRHDLRQRGVPYGVAISLGFVSYLYLIL